MRGFNTKRTFTIAVVSTAIAIGFPIAVLAVAQNASNTEPALAPSGTQDQVQDANQTQAQSGDLFQTRRRLQVHIEEGPPEGFEPIQMQQRLHRQDQLAANGGQRMGPTAKAPKGTVNGTQQQSQPGQAAPNGQVTPRGDCPNDGTCINNGDCPAGSLCTGGQGRGIHRTNQSVKGS